MPPPKLKMHRAPGSGKLKSIPRAQPIPSTSQGIQDPDQREAQEKFELELAWCIQRLEETLNSGKLNQKQSKIHHLRLFSSLYQYNFFFTFRQ